MFPHVGYRDDEGDTDPFRDVSDYDGVEDPMLETQLMPAKHGSKSATQFRAGARRVPSPFPNVRAAHEIPPPPPPRAVRLSRKPIEPPPMRWPLYSIAEEETGTGSDMRAPIHYVGPVIPSTAVLAARQRPWSIPGTPPAFIPYPAPLNVTPFPQPAVSEVQAVVRVPRRRMSMATGAMLWIFALACGIAAMAIVRGDLTEKGARAGLAHAIRGIDAVLAR